MRPLVLAGSFPLLLAGSLVPGADAPPVPSRPLVACEAGGTVTIERASARWSALLERRRTLGEEGFRREVESLVSDAVALDAMAARILEGRWDDLDEVRRGRFLAALTRSLGNDLVTLGEAEERPELIPAAEEPRLDDGTLRAEYRIRGAEDGGSVTFHLTDAADGSCAVVDVRGGDIELVKDVRKRVKKLADDYSVEQAIADLGGYDHVVLEDFESTPEGELPVGWTWKDSDDDEHKPYRIKVEGGVEGGNKYLEATDEGESVILGKEIKWNLDEYPYVSFRVRVHRIPVGGDERDDDKVDSAAGLYFTYKKKMLGLIPESVKYVWSSTLPVGAAARRDGTGRPWQVVFGSGEEGLGEWRTYVFDLRQAYRDTFGGKPPSKPIGIGVLSDANSLKSHAYADYDDIRALRTAPEGVTSGVHEIVSP